jgi:uncharacterized repeat protein (TIGR03803 family)
MHSPGTMSKTMGPWNISDGGPRLGSTKLVTAIIRGALILAAISALLLIAASPAQAQTETVLHNFEGSPDGSYPTTSNLTFDGAGNLYGTTEYGGLGYGTVFELSPNGSGSWNETVLHSFTGGADGANPMNANVILDSVGNLYGTTAFGGANGSGIVYELSRAGTNWTETVLYSFAGGADGVSPTTGVIMDPAGNLYGSTFFGVFELTPSAGGWTEQVLFNGFTGTYNAGLTMDAAGNLFGSTQNTVFELSPNGNGGWNWKVIHSFSVGKDGSAPQGSLVLDHSGNLYGTTAIGGGKNYGTVYELSPGVKGKWKEKILYHFQSEKQGLYPEAGIVFDPAGNIYGTTVGGGAFNAGTIFELVAPIGTIKYYKHKVLWSFDITQGDEPYGGLLVDSALDLYGTASGGGSGSGCNVGCGVVFKLTP